MRVETRSLSLSPKASSIARTYALRHLTPRNLIKSPLCSPLLRVQVQLVDSYGHAGSGNSRVIGLAERGKAAFWVANPPKMAVKKKYRKSPKLDFFVFFGSLRSYNGLPCLKRVKSRYKTSGPKRGCLYTVLFRTSKRRYINPTQATKVL